jgi:hypothetical protein
VTVLGGPDRNPVTDATVSVPEHASQTTGQTGRAALSGLSPGEYTLKTSARGYYAARQRVRVSSGKPIVVQLTYRPPIGTFLWNIGPGGRFWVEGTVTKSTVTATEYDWSCTRDKRTGKLVGTWSKFAGALPYAIAPDTLAPEWTRGHFPASGPPRPPSGCAYGPTTDQIGHTPFGIG